MRLIQGLYDGDTRDHRLNRVQKNPPAPCGSDDGPARTISKKRAEGRRTVVTGLGPVCPFGVGLEAFLDGIEEGRSTASRISRFDATEFPVRIAAEVPSFRPADFFPIKTLKRTGRLLHLYLSAAAIAWDDAGLHHKGIDPGRVGVIVGNCLPAGDWISAQQDTLRTRGPDRVSPYIMLNGYNDVPSAHLAEAFRACGPSLNISSACSSSSDAMGLGLDLIRSGRADVVMCGGAEAPIEPLSFAAFSKTRSLSTRNNEPSKASRPFERARDGAVLGEGAGILILEDLEHATQRGARIYGELAGHGASCLAHGISVGELQPWVAEVDPPRKAMEAAIDDAALRIDEIDYVSAHGVSGVADDTAETFAMKRVFGEKAYKIPLSSTKSMIGHCLGASGALDMIAVMLAFEHDLLPPTINYEEQDPRCDLDYVPNKARKAKVNAALSVCMGIGGKNSALVATRWSHA